MKLLTKIIIISLFIIFSVSLVSAANTTPQVKKDTYSSVNEYTVSPNGVGVGGKEGNLFKTLDYIEENNEKANVNLKSGTYKFNNNSINGTYYSNRRLGKNKLKNITFNGNNTIFDADNVRFFNIQEGTTATFTNICFVNGNYTSGGSIYSEGSLILINCSFINSTAQRYGGSLYLRGDNIIKDSFFSYSSVSDGRGSGGSIYHINGSLNLENVVINHSFAHIHGGSITSINSEVNINYLNVNDSYYYNNRGIGDVIYTNNSNILINNSITNNTLYAGGALGFNNTNSKIYNSQFLNITMEKNIVCIGTISPGLLFNNKKSEMENITISVNPESSFSLPLIYNNGSMNIKEITIYGNKSVSVENLEAYVSHFAYNLPGELLDIDLSTIFILNYDKLIITGSVKNVKIISTKSVVLKNMVNSSIEYLKRDIYGYDEICNISYSNISVSAYRAKVYNISHSNVSTGGFFSDIYNIHYSNVSVSTRHGIVENISFCKNIDCGYSRVNNVTGYNPESSVNFGTCNISNCIFTGKCGLYDSKVFNTVYQNLTDALDCNTVTFENCSFRNTKNIVISTVGWTDLNISNSVFDRNTGWYVITIGTSWSTESNAKIFLNNVTFSNNNGFSLMRVMNYNDVITSNSCKYLNNSMESDLLFWLSNQSSCYFTNNKFVGNNLPMNITGNLDNASLYGKTFKGYLKAETNGFYNTSVQTGKVELYVDNVLYSSFNVKNSLIPIVIQNLSMGTHQIRVKYFDDSHSFKASQRTFKLIVSNKTLAKVITGDKYAYAGSKIIFNASVVDYNNKAIPMGRVVIKINGITQTSITLKNTNKITYNYIVPNYTAKKYKLQIVYVGDDKYARYEANKTLHILNQSTYITADNVINYQDKTVKINVQLRGKQTGISAQVGTVGFKINGITAKINGKPIIEKVKNGKATFTYHIPRSMKADKYQILITYSGGRNLFETKTKTSTLTVKDHTTKINIKTKTVKQSKTNRIIAEVKDSVSLIKTGSASLYLNNVKVSECTIRNGEAIFNYFVPNTLLGSYTAKIEAKGTYTDKNYTQSKITVIK